MNEELDLLIDNFDHLGLESIYDEYQILMNIGGGPNPVGTSRQESIDPDESYAPMYNKPYKQFYDKIR